MSDAPVVEPVVPAVEPEVPATEPVKTEEPAKPVEAEKPAEPIDPKMVVPETADGYALPVPEGDDGAFAKTAASWFHEAAIPPAQAEKLAAKWNEFAAAQHAAQEQALADADKQAEARFKADDSALRKEWGDKYEANIELGRRAYREFGFDDEVVTALEDKVGAAKLFKIFANIGQKIGEDSALGLDKGSNSLSFASATEKLYGGKA